MKTPHSQLHNWMKQTPQIGNLRIDELILPGTHDSGSDKKAPNFSFPQEITQDVSPFEQLQGGIRVLDLRVSFYETYETGVPARFQLFHNTSSGRTITVDIIQMLEQFYQGQLTPGDTDKELIILNFHQFKGFTPAVHDELQDLIISTLQHRLIPYSLRTLSVGDIWQQHPGKTVVIAYNHGVVSDLFWDGVNQRWSGDNLNTTHSLKIFMDSVTEERKPESELRSIQCAKYVLPFHTPDDFSDKVDQWFHSEDENSYIQKFYIINTDWSLRSNIVQNCVSANAIKAARNDRP